MIIELLKFKVPPQHQEEFILKDREIWTTALANYPGFINKEVWLNPDDDTELIFIIRWASKEDWESIPKEDLVLIENNFNQTIGQNYPITETAEYQVFKTT
ncbi:TIGR03792 family protein [Cronbergia sp. UHCC 0137]|uniref:TIGR03792 family protein n=1 Tax=Cronbergia sp. UHCC 0137 TaxID=3110239 RepID=UPI002B1F972E|nr:TIGR03792 family protein [Cronbergia sp. UHCC 0137]MEA5618848.1 TIGR03792 family protein [Cronbergia sp. UHCC 0137]